MYICVHNSNKQKTQDMAKFKQEVIEAIKADADLFALVAKEMDIKPTSVHENLKRNGKSLNQYSVIAAVAKYLKKKPSDLVEEELMGQQS
jgi:hypothetical protein